MPKGGRQLLLSVTIVNPPDQAAVTSSRLIPGPFVVVAVQAWEVAGAADSYEITVVPTRVFTRFPDVDTVEVTGARFMELRPRVRRAGALEIGDPNMYTGRPYLWPWYVYEGSVGAIALWGLAEVGTAVITASVAVWELEEFVPAGAKPARDAYADAAARLASWRTLVERQLQVR